MLRTLSRCVALLSVAATAAVVAPTAAAAPAAAVTRIDRVDAGLATVWVFSPSMGRVIPNQVLLAPRPGPAPVFYLLNGRSGGIEGDSWVKQTRYRQFFAGRQIMVVSPLGGPFSWYANWQRPDPRLGVNRWETYLNSELPSALAARFPTTGRKAIAGLSLSGGPALDLAGRSRGAYRAAASYSGCPAISSPAGIAAVTATTAFGGGNALNMFGAPSNPAWVDHDPTRNPARLRGVAVYLASTTGVPGAIDGGANPQLALGPSQVEQVTKFCTDQLAAALRGAGVRHTYRVFGQGAHTWSLFEAEMRDSWRVIGPAIGA
ncbi:esterase family protein [Williamsia sp. CHRR-6]|nr:esterase family protein [Williamsia sp. CHRR-6]